MNRTTQTNLIFVFIVSLWGTSFALVKGALPFTTPILFTVARFLLAALIWTILFGRVLKGASKGTFSRGVFLGVILGSGIVLQTAGLKYTTAGMSGFITGLAVVIVPLFVVLIERRLPKLTSLAGVALCTAGLAVLSSPTTVGLNRGDLLTIGCAVMFGLYIVLVEVFTGESGYDPRALAVAQGVGIVLVSLAAMVVLEKPRIEMTWPLIWRGTALGLMAALTLALQLHWQRFISATRVAVIFTLEPPLAALFGFLLLGEILTGVAYVGGGLIFAGMVIAEGGARLIPGNLRQLSGRESQQVLTPTEPDHNVESDD
jgi:drug/metabolite transporter (DMT)-like permease